VLMIVVRWHNQPESGIYPEQQILAQICLFMIAFLKERRCSKLSGIMTSRILKVPDCMQSLDRYYQPQKNPHRRVLTCFGAFTAA